MTGQHCTLAAPRRPADFWCLVLLSSLAWLILSGIVQRLTGPAAAMVLLAAVFLLGASDQVLEHARCSLPPRRKLDGHALAAALALLLTLVLAVLRGRLSPAADALAFQLAVIAVALAGGLIPAVIEAVAGSLLLRSLVTVQPGKAAIPGVSDTAVLGVLVGLAVVVGLLAEGAARRTRQAESRPDAHGAARGGQPGPALATRLGEGRSKPPALIRRPAGGPRYRRAAGRRRGIPRPARLSGRQLAGYPPAADPGR